MSLHQVTLLLPTILASAADITTASPQALKPLSDDFDVDDGADNDGDSRRLAILVGSFQIFLVIMFATFVEYPETSFSDSKTSSTSSTSTSRS